MNLKRLPTKSARMAAYAERQSSKGKPKVRADYSPPAVAETGAEQGTKISLAELRKMTGH